MKKTLFILPIFLLLAACSAEQTDSVQSSQAKAPEQTGQVQGPHAAQDARVDEVKQQDSGKVSVRILSATAVRQALRVNADGETVSQEMDIECEVELKNNTGSVLKVQSNFYSGFDGLELVIMDEDGEELDQEASILHQSPFSSNPLTFELPAGATWAKLCFRISAPKGYSIFEARKAKLIGGLSGIRYESGLESNTVDVVANSKIETDRSRRLCGSRLMIEAAVGRAELIIHAKALDTPPGDQDEAGVLNYTAEFEVLSVLKRGLENKKIRLYYFCIEAELNEQGVRKGEEVILFIRVESGSEPLLTGIKIIPATEKALQKVRKLIAERQSAGVDKTRPLCGSSLAIEKAMKQAGLIIHAEAFDDFLIREEEFDEGNVIMNVTSGGQKFQVLSVIKGIIKSRQTGFIYVCGELNPNERRAEEGEKVILFLWGDQNLEAIKMVPATNEALEKVEKLLTEPKRH